MLRKHLGSISVTLAFCFLPVLDVSAQANFTRHTTHNSLRGAYWVYVKDIDKDGDRDPVTAAFDGIDWWENNDNESFSKHFLGSLQSAEMTPACATLIVIFKGLSGTKLV